MDVKKRRKEAVIKRVEKKHVCPNCEARFSFPNKLRLHIKSHHSLANACELCPERFNRFNELRKHMRNAHRIIHQCHLCAYSSSVKAELRKHVVKCHEKGVRCTVDGCTATVAYNRLRRHIREVHCSDDRGSSTITVDDTVDDESIAAESGHDDTGSFDDINDRSPTIEDSAVTNDFSEEKFVIIDEDSLEEMEEQQEKSLDNHSATVSPQSSVSSEGVSPSRRKSGDCVADSCCQEMDNSGKTAPDQPSEVPDQEKDVLEGTKRNICSEIPFYVYTETGEYACQKCGKVFQDMCNARRHLNRVHFKCYDEKVRLKKYSCNFPGCIQRFPCPSKLQDHKTSAHSEETPFECETCLKKFRTRAQFAVHLRRYHLVSIKDVPGGFTEKHSRGNVTDEVALRKGSVEEVGATPAV